MKAADLSYDAIHKELVVIADGNINNEYVIDKVLLGEDKTYLIAKKKTAEVGASDGQE